MATRGTIYTDWQAMTPEQRWERFCELEDELFRLQDERAKEVRVTLSMDKREAARMLAGVLDTKGVG